MNIKSLFSIVLGLYIPSLLYSQNCPFLYEKGNLINKVENTQRTFCFKTDPETIVDSIPGLYHTKYTIAFEKGREACVIHFYFYQLMDSISIKYINTLTGNIVVDNVVFDKKSSSRMFKNYNANDTSITENDYYSTLFTVLNPERPYITLNQFQLPDNKDTYLTFTRVNPEKLLQHRLDALAYLKWKDSMNIVKEKENQKIARHKRYIDSIFQSMREYKETVIKEIIAGDEEFARTGSVVEANSIYSEEFKKKLDSIFVEYFRKKILFENYDSEIKFTFICDGEGKIDIKKTQIDSVNSSIPKWFDEDFKVYLVPTIESARYRTAVTPRANPNVISDFDNKYSDAVNYLNSDNTNNSEHQVFVNIKNEVYKNLDSFIVSRDIKTPTKYFYSFRYKTAIRNEDWIYEIDKKGNETIGPKKPTEYISNELKALFKNKIAKPKVGKYSVEILSIYFDNKQIGQDIQLYEKKVSKSKQ